MKADDVPEDEFRPRPAPSSAADADQSSSADGPRRSIIALVLTTGAQGLVSLTNFALVIVATHVLTAAEVGYFVLALSSISFVSGYIQSINVESLAMESRGAAELASTRVRSTVTVRALVVATPISLIAAVIGLLLVPQLAALIIVTAVILPLISVVDSHRLWLLATGAAPRAVSWDVPWIVAASALVLGSLVLRIPLDPAILLLCYGIPVGAVGLILFGRSRFRDGFTLPDAALRRHHRNLSIEYLINQAVNQALLFTVGLRLGAPDAAAFRTSQNLFGPLNILISASRAALFPPLGHALRSRGQVQQWIRVVVPFVALTSGVLVGVLVLGSIFGNAILGVTADRAVPLLPALGVQYVALIVQNAALIALRATQNSAYSATARSVQALLAACSGALGLALGSLQVLAWALAVGSLLASALWVHFALRALRGYSPRSTGGAKS